MAESSEMYKQPVAVTSVIATFVLSGLFCLSVLSSCGNKIDPGEILDLDEVPLQTVDSMRAVQTKDGILQMRMEAASMERYQKEEESYELFPKGFDIYGYTSEGLLETWIRSDEARHTTSKNDEKWEAYGNVLITNYIKGQKMETDTLFWDRENHRIHTHCFVRLYSPEGFMQGYGLESDEMARNAKILRPFDSFGIIRDSASAPAYIDSVNFIGPFQKR